MSSLHAIASVAVMAARLRDAATENRSERSLEKTSSLSSPTDRVDIGAAGASGGNRKPNADPWLRALLMDVALSDMPVGRRKELIRYAVRAWENADAKGRERIAQLVRMRIATESNPIHNVEKNPLDWQAFFQDLLDDKDDDDLTDLDVLLAKTYS